MDIWASTLIVKRQGSVQCVGGRGWVQCTGSMSATPQESYDPLLQLFKRNFLVIKTL